MKMKNKANIKLAPANAAETSRRQQSTSVNENKKYIQPKIRSSTCSREPKR
jgi:hypothetical protein